MQRIYCETIRIRGERRTNPLTAILIKGHKAKRALHVRPIIVIKVRNLKRYILLDGQARLLAYRALKLKTIRAYVYTLPAGMKLAVYTQLVMPDEIR